MRGAARARKMIAAEVDKPSIVNFVIMNVEIGRLEWFQWFCIFER